MIPLQHRVPRTPSPRLLDRRASLARLATFVAGGWAAGFSARLGGGRPAMAQAFADRTFTDSAGRAVHLESPPRRVLAAGPPASVALYAIAPETLVGWVRVPSRAEQAFLAAPYRDLPAHGPLTGRGSIADPESVLALKPDLVLEMGSIDDTQVSLADRVQAQTGVPFALIDGSLARSPASIRLLGQMIGAADAAEDLAAYAETTLGELAAKLSALRQSDRPRVYCGRGPQGLVTGLAASTDVEVLETVGAINVAAAAGSGGLATVSLEQILDWNPAVILALDRPFYETVGDNPLWQGVEAVREGRVYLQPRLPFGWFDSPPGINRLIGVRWLMAVLHPDLFPQDLRAETHGFYSRFYHLDLSAAQLDRLLSGAIPPAG